MQIREVPFGSVPMGARFFDPYSGEVFQKLSPSWARLMQDMKTVSTFGPDEMVATEAKVKDAFTH